MCGVKGVKALNLCIAQESAVIGFKSRFMISLAKQVRARWEGARLRKLGCRAFCLGGLLPSMAVSQSASWGLLWVPRVCSPTLLIRIMPHLYQTLLSVAPCKMLFLCITISAPSAAGTIVFPMYSVMPQTIQDFHMTSLKLSVSLIKTSFFSLNINTYKSALLTLTFWF